MLLQEGQQLLKASREAFVKDDLPGLMDRIQSELEASEGDFIVRGDQPTIADLELLSSLRFLGSGMVDHIPRDVVSGFPAVQAYVDRLQALPEIKEWKASEQARREAAQQ